MSLLMSLYGQQRPLLGKPTLDWKTIVQRRKVTHLAHPNPKAAALAPNEPHLQKRGKYYYVRFNEDGRDRKVSTGERTRLAARRWVEANMSAFDLGAKRLDSRVGYDWRRAMQLDVERCSNRGRSDYYVENDLAQRHRLLSFFQGKAAIGEADLTAFRDFNRQAGRQDDSTRRAIIVLRRGVALLTKANIHIRICPKEANPDLKVTLRSSALRGRYIPEEQLSVWLRHLAPSPRAVAILELTTGLRASELRRLLPENLVRVDRYPGVSAFISLPEGQGKDKSGRSMALCDAAYDALCHLWERKGGLVYNPKGAWRTAAKRVGLHAQGRLIGRVHERDMRHNFATCNGRHWSDMQGLMRALGHEDGSHARYHTATPQSLAKFATFAAETYGLARHSGPARQNRSKLGGHTGTLAWAHDFLKTLHNTP